MSYTVFSLLAQTLKGHKGWQPTSRDAAPKPENDV